MTSHTPKLRDAVRRLRRASQPRAVRPKDLVPFMTYVFGKSLHAKTLQSLSMATVGVLQAARLGIHAIGRGLALAMLLDSKHTTKQVDRLLSNANVSLWRLFPSWVRFVVGARTEIVVALDWTDFDDDDQTTIALYLVTRHGRATPLIWHTVYKSTLKDKRNGYEDEVLECLHDALPEGVRVTVLADRGFGDQKRYEHLRKLSIDYVIRFRQDIAVSDAATAPVPAIDWLPPSGRATLVKNALVTMDRCEVPAVVLVHNKRMKDPWCLATSRSDLSAREVIRLYGKRFSVEETFRDTKDIHFGMGLKATHIGDSSRRDRLLLLGAVAHALLTLLGAAGERCGLDRKLRTNTSSKRQLSLYRQGLFWYQALPNMGPERWVLLMTAYEEVLREHAFFCEIFGVI
jgi:Transposase DDE domain